MARQPAASGRWASRGGDMLTSREIEVLAWVARGRSAAEIAEILHIAKRTVDAHVSSVIFKTGAVNRTHAVAIAIRDRLIKI
jgi:LuxR family transcriptional regulator, quorum-sensing system regulator BjaR1